MRHFTTEVGENGASLTAYPEAVPEGAIERIDALPQR